MILLNGKMEEELAKLPSNSVDSVVTDPPYGISFMSKKWDYDVPSSDMWKEVYRVLKPGGHLISFSSARTYHRMAVEVEDAGFEIRDQIMWVYGSGFPKSHNIGRAVDAKLKTGKSSPKAMREAAMGDDYEAHKLSGTENFGNTGGAFAGQDPVEHQYSNEWEGWGTALKPAHEPMVLARKPFKGTVVDNVLKWGVGGLNIDASRVGNEVISTHHAPKGTFAGGEPDRGSDTSTYSNHEGRFPANFIHDGSDEVVDLFPAKAGAQAPVSGNEPSHTKQNAIYGDYSMVEGKPMEVRDELGSAARFFYVPKVSKKDRNEGLDGKLPVIGNLNASARDERIARLGTSDNHGCNHYEAAAEAAKAEGKLLNTHPTVKPTDLMHYLIRMVTPAGGIVLDPFMGSGSTGKAAIRHGYDFIGIEMEQQSYDVAKARIDYEVSNVECD